MKAKKLPSGNWRVQVYLGKDENGKNIMKSVTAPTRQEAMMKAASYSPAAYEGIRLEDACARFIEERGPELSPSTVRGYLGTLRTCIQGNRIANMLISKITTPELQSWVSGIKGSAKTKKNHLGFVQAVIRYYDPDKTFHVRIRETEKAELYTPTFDEVNLVLAVCDPETRRAALLGIFGMRRGEICALDASDLDRASCLVRISKAVAKTKSGEWVKKTPKTKSSVRWVEIPQEVMDELPLSGPVVSVSPDVITNRFVRAVRAAGVPHFRFHDLRSFFASVAVTSIGISERTVQDLGGWKTNHVLKSHYERTMTDQKRKDTDALISYFSENLKLKRG